MQGVSRRKNQMLAGAIGVAVLLLWVTGAGPAALAPAALLFLPIFWLYLTSIALLIEWAVLARHRRHPELPFGPASWNGHRGTAFVLLGIVVAITLVREGAFSPYLTYDFSCYTTQRTLHYNTTTGGTSSTVGNAPPVRLAGQYIECLVSCSPSGSTMCAAYSRRFSCDSDHPERPVRTPAVLVTGSVSFDSEPFCYTPLYKSGATTFHATLKVGISTPNGSANHSFMLTGNIAQQMTGIGSCSTFSRLMGEEGADAVAKALNQYIQAN